MRDSDEFRFRCHELLLQVDATTAKMMMLVVAKEVCGAQWDDAAKLQISAFEAWSSYLHAPHG
ncbi:hypothetical protein [Pseudomonas syringae group genomosp. 3]|uniref:hypothetical protein n=1 Tax=Pseudomonas syringae group genomosp. 3 TaxID=251701 RepID=UPI000CF128DF|nr:hypothetical protein [Pseudomonas syringae group genomosp. 3]